jgi:hypothetical protein
VTVRSNFRIAREQARVFVPRWRALVENAAPDECLQELIALNPAMLEKFFSSGKAIEAAGECGTYKNRTSPTGPHWDITFRERLC